MSTERKSGDMSLPLPSFDELKAFLREYYLHDRFEGRDGRDGYGDYSDCITNSVLNDLRENGESLISWHDCNRGRHVFFDRSLTVLNPDEPPSQFKVNRGNLTHIFGQST